MNYPSIPDFENNLLKIDKQIVKTPVYYWNTPVKSKLFNKKNIILKLELLQKTGTFKIRGALSVLGGLAKEQKQHGIIAGTAGNHGIAVSYAAKLYNINAKIIIPKTINQFRLKCLSAYNPEIIQVDNIAQIIDKMNELGQAENRTIIHPYEHPNIILGTGSVGYEFLKQVPDLDAIIIPIGGGGLISGIACVIKQLKPSCKIYGVEPKKAATMSYSINQGYPGKLNPPPNSIADSLSAPNTEPYSFSLCQKFVDEIALVSEEELKQAMIIMFEEFKLATEPAGAAVMAGLLGPLRDKLQNLNNIGLIISGSNIDYRTFFKIL